VFPKGKFLSFNYDPAGGGEVLNRINGVGEMQKLPSGGWFNFGQTDSVVFNYSAPNPGDDVILFWNVS
jgi:hypothetical protein